MPESDWNYGLIDPDSADPNELTLRRGPWPADQFPWKADTVPYSVMLKAKKIPGWQIDRYRLTAPLPLNPAAAESAEEVEMIPMGAARLRLSALPALKE